MKNRFLFLFIFSFTFTFAQTPDKIYYKTQTFENKEMKILIDNVIATSSGIKFKLRIFNNGTQYIIYKPSESTLKIGEKEAHANDDWMVIRPGDDDYQTIDIKGKDLLMQKNFDWVMDGLYSASLNVGGLTTENMQVPPQKNFMNTGGYAVTLDKFNKDKEGTGLKFKVSYTGDKVGIVEPNKIAMKLKDGKEYINFESNYKPLIFASGTKNNFSVTWKDIPASAGNMQTDEMTILFRDAFKEFIPAKLDSPTIHLELDSSANK